MRRRVLLSSKKTDGEAVDLGLSVLWASGNLTKDSNDNYYIAEPYEYGAYFSWANIDGHNVAGQGESYSFKNATYSSTTGSNLESDISGTLVLKTYDAARVKLGGTWRLPTRSECYDLNGLTWNWKSSGNTDYNRNCWL